MDWWMILIAIVVILAGSTSLLGAWHTRREIATGRPSYLSLSDRTGIWDRKELAERYGEPDDDDHYTVSAATVARFPRRLWQRFFDSMLLDLASIGGTAVSLWLAATGKAGAVWVLTICGGYQIVSWGVTAWIVLKNASWEE